MKKQQRFTRSAIALACASFLFPMSAAWADSAKLTFNGHSYQRFDTSMSWTNAKIFCENKGAHLATITSQAENDFVVANFVSSSVPIILLGASDVAKEGTWQWITGEAWSYTNWHSGEPNNGGGVVANENYLAFHSLNGLVKWNDIQATSNPPLCEWDGIIASTTISISASSFVNGQNVAMCSGTCAYGTDSLLNAPPYIGTTNSAEWDFNVPTSGKYELFAEYAAAQSRPVTISFNGITTFTSALAAITGGWMPTNRQVLSQGFVQLAAGKTTMRVASSSVFSHIKGFKLVPIDTATTSTPTCVLTPTPSTITAGQPATLTATCTPAATSYQWSDTACASTSSTCTVTPNITTNYSVKGSNSGGMGVAAEGKVVVGGVKTKDGLAYLTLGTTKSLTTDIFNNWGPGEGGLSDDYPTHLLYSPEDYFTNLIYSIETNSTELPIDKKTIQPLGGRIPIILVHGWQGDDGKTKPQSQMTKKLSADDYWYNLIQFFQNNPTLKSKYKLYVYKYPSYKHVTFNALKLKTLLDAMPDLKNAQQMSFIGHSMGTIVIRSLFEEHDFDHNRAQKIILLDGVHHGSPAAVPGLVYLNTDIPFGWGKDLYTLGSNDIQWDNYDNIYNATSLYNDKPINKLIFNIMFDYSNASNYTAYLPNTPNQYIAPTLSSRIGLLFSPEKNIASSPNSLENQLITKADEQDVNFYCFPNPSIQKQCIRRSENSAFDTIYRKRIIDLMINNPQISLPSIKNSSDVNSYKSSTISYLP